MLFVCVCVSAQSDEVDPGQRDSTGTSYLRPGWGQELLDPPAVAQTQPVVQHRSHSQAEVGFTEISNSSDKQIYLFN